MIPLTNIHQTYAPNFGTYGSNLKFELNEVLKMSDFEKKKDLIFLMFLNTPGTSNRNS
jgi:hypothetical protein